MQFKNKKLKFNMEASFTKDNVTEILVRYLAVAQSKGVFSIKDASFLYKITTEISKETDNVKEKYDAIIRAIIISHGKGCYTLEEASLFEEIVKFLENEDLVTK